MLLVGLHSLSHLAAHSAASPARVLLLHLIESTVALGKGQVRDRGVRFFHQVVGSEGADELSEDAKESGADCSKDQDATGDAPLHVATLFATVMVVAMTSTSSVLFFVGTMFATKLLSFSTVMFVLALVIIHLTLKNGIVLASIASLQMTTTVTLVNRCLRDVRQVQGSLNIFDESREELLVGRVRVTATSLLSLVLLHHLLGSLLSLLVSLFGCFLVVLSHLFADNYFF